MSMNFPGFFAGTEMPNAAWWEALWPDSRGILTAVGLAPGMDAIDLCSGDGWFTLQIARIARHVIAIDIDATLLDVARHRLAEGGAELRVRGRGCLTTSPRSLARWSTSYSWRMRSTAFPTGRLARGARDALKPDGRLAIINWHRRPCEETPVLGEPRGPRTELRLSPEETIATVEQGGLALAGLVEIPPYHYGVGFARLG